MKHKLLLLLPLVLLVFNAMAQNTKNISLDEAIQLGLKNSKQLKLSQVKVD